jgi:hypothetical protein
MRASVGLYKLHGVGVADKKHDVGVAGGVAWPVRAGQEHWAGPLTLISGS